VPAPCGALSVSTALNRFPEYRPRETYGPAGVCSVRYCVVTGNASKMLAGLTVLQSCEASVKSCAGDFSIQCDRHRDRTGATSVDTGE
jgi:hypothetical protein